MGQKYSMLQRVNQAGFFQHLIQGLCPCCLITGYIIIIIIIINYVYSKLIYYTNIPSDLMASHELLNLNTGGHLSMAIYAWSSIGHPHTRRKSLSNSMFGGRVGVT